MPRVLIFLLCTAVPVIAACSQANSVTLGDLASLQKKVDGLRADLHFAVCGDVKDCKEGAGQEQTPNSLATLSRDLGKIEKLTCGDDPCQFPKESRLGQSIVAFLCDSSLTKCTPLAERFVAAPSGNHGQTETKPDWVKMSRDLAQIRFHLSHLSSIINASQELSKADACTGAMQSMVLQALGRSTEPVDSDHCD